MDVFSTNKFALLPDNAMSNDVDSATAVLEKKNKKQQQQQKQAKPVAPLPERARPSERAIKPDYPSRGGFRSGPGREQRGGDSQQPAFARRERREGAPSQRGRGAPRGRGRVDDRHSATGLVDSDKKKKQGWLGSPEDMPRDGDKAAEEAEKDSAQDGVATPVEEAEPEEKVRSLNDYYSTLGSSKVDTKHNLRKANEGVDKKLIKGTVALSKPEEEFFASTVSRKKNKQKERKEKQFVDIEQRFNDQTRGAFRGARGDGSRNDRRGPRQNNVNLNDKNAFPTLG
ncbi:hypothetical protein COEREDRAFT_93009 [Coemansia reversa NRRL 1564]|uniref:Hyaluronan/mRNA-binding protein domain-containing protein n=1 Tax=Coemansia reversa (strain ATCC 12441 / NRRL 1564) TaxID=763665 RepID=A0A2G5B9V8_COERN|nr:hypothetical protein COEREDRAFT_93009 [Coemansia reversa NRRL 1564]|eukprot:PIA15793.1 hypothetical protein COEREDRAFT_93009 [Coemansia reversa NRRL 1564]